MLKHQLQVGDNKLIGGLEVLSSCPKLSRLGLAGNKIGELEDLKPLVCVRASCFDNCLSTIIDIVNYARVSGSVQLSNHSFN